MAFRINTNSLKNAMGTVFLLAAAFFVCSTLISIRTVFADPVVISNPLAGRVTRISPRATTNRTTVVSAQPGKKTATSRGVTSNRTVASRSGGAVRRTTATDTTTASRGVVARNQTANNARSERAVRARTSTTPSRVSAAGTVMAGNRAGTTTSYSYLASSLYTGSYSNIIDSTTGLISADAYSTCMESYYTCMDEICSARSDTKGRCSCAGRATNFLSAETALEKANEELIKLSGQLSLLIATKGKGDDLAAAFSLTDAEKVMNCVSYKEAEDKNTWCEDHPTFNADGSVATCAMPSYCNSTGTGANNFGFDIKNIDGSSSDILAQLKAWADAKDLAKEYTVTDTNNLLNKYTTISGIVNGLAGITDNSEISEAALDSLANKWGYKLFEYAHNNVCGRVLDSCFNGIYEACGTPVSVTDSDGKSHTKCANGATSNCPFNYNSYISVVTSGDNQGDVKLNERNTNSTTVSSTSACFGYSTTTVSTGTRSGTITSNDPYATLRGPVADARRSIMQKYLLDANAACDVYGAALKQTAQNINYQKIAAEQALQQKRLEFKQEEEAAILANASAAIDNFNECVSEIWDCYEEYADEENWTTARIKAYCSQISQVPHCYGTMICSPLKTQYIAVVDKPDNTSCKMVENGQMYDYRNDTCRNVVTISEILYGTGMDPASGSATSGNSAAIREACLQEALNCGSDELNEGGCLRKWKKPKAETQQS
ncbi:MAG: hypothetical protein IKF41_02065 [Alphaproteobacteria bacterium]|nr:hypothetical protein [Alphaproteobacteria bacterium]